VSDDVAVTRIAPELTPYEVIERVISSGDIGKMSPEARVAFYWRTCETLGLNPLTQPFQYLSLNGKIVLYAKKDATEQLRRVNRVSVTELRRERDENLGTYTVYAHGRLPDGREDEASGVVSIKGMSGEALANQVMKAETKAKRRLTLSLVGLGFLDESEIEGLGDRLDVDVNTGEIVAHERPKPASLVDQVRQQAEALAAASQTDEEQPEPEVATSTPEPFMDAPMTPEESARFSVVDDEPERAPVEDVEDMGLPFPDEDEGTMTEEEEAEAARLVAEEEERSAREAKPRVDPTAAPGLTVAELADRARDANVGKLRFASVLDIVPADVGKRIESMTDEQRYALALQLGIVG
jgi:hypothetical protein